jgi:hypothetical protein
MMYTPQVTPPLNCAFPSQTPLLPGCVFLPSFSLSFPFSLIIVTLPEHFFVSVRDQEPLWTGSYTPQSETSLWPSHFPVLKHLSVLSSTKSNSQSWFLPCVGCGHAKITNAQGVPIQQWKWIYTKCGNVVNEEQWNKIPYLGMDKEVVKMPLHARRSNNYCGRI